MLQSKNPTPFSPVPDPRFGTLDSAVAALNFERLKWKLARSSDAKMSPETCDLAEREYRRFLTLKVAFPDVTLVPSMLVDEFWHTHILDTVAYARDCDAVFGGFLHHFPHFGDYGGDDEVDMDAAFAETTTLYERTFGEKPPKSNLAASEAGRCRGKQCHAPTNCRCRGKG